MIRGGDDSKGTFRAIVEDIKAIWKSIRWDIMFDVEKKYKELGVPRNVYVNLRREIKKEFPHDEMLFELHLIRALKSYASTKR